MPRRYSNGTFCLKATLSFRKQRSFFRHGIVIAQCLFLASKDPINLDAKMLSAKQQQWIKKRLVTIDDSQGIILTDNLNPLEHLQTRKAEHYRQVLLDWFGTDLLIR